MQISIRWLTLLPLAALLVVVIGGYFVVESFRDQLREQAQVDLEHLASALALRVQGSADMMARLSGVDEARSNLLASFIDQGISLDGRDSEWSDIPGSQFDVHDLLDIRAPYTQESLVLELKAAANNRFLFLFFHVTDDSVVYREINVLSVHRNDHVLVSLLDSGQRLQRFTISSQQPGAVTAVVTGVGGRALREEPAMTGYWLGREDGYNLELQIDRRLLGERLSLAVADIDDSDSRELKFIMGNAPLEESAELGQLYMADPALNDLPQRLSLASLAINNVDGVPVLMTGQQPGSLVGASPIAHQGRVIGELVLTRSESSIGGILTRIHTDLVILTVLALLVGIVFSLVANMMISRRIKRVQQDLGAIATVQGRIRAPYEADPGHDALGELSQELGRLTARVWQYNDYLERMASRLNHELRTPVSVVRSSLDNIKGSSDDVYVQRARQGIDRLTSILNKMMEARRLEESLDEDAVSPVDLVALVSGCVAGYESVYPEAQFQLSIETDSASVTGIADLLAQMLDKLVNNAVGFSDSKEPIKVRLNREEDVYAIRVSNTGQNLSPQVEDLFESMVSSRAQADGGTHLGLGLYIARTIAQFHGGVIGIANREDTRGVVVTVRLPVDRITARLL